MGLYKYAPSKTAVWVVAWAIVAVYAVSVAVFIAKIGL